MIPCIYVVSVENLCCCSVTKSCLTLQTHELQHARLLCPSQSLWVCSHSCPLSLWCHPTISTSLLLPSIFPSIRVFSNESPLHIRWLKYWSFCIIPSNEYQGWFPLELTGLISSLSKGLSRVFSSTTVQKYQFFSTQPSLWSNSHIQTWLWEKS